MFSDDVKAEAIRRLSGGKSFIMADSDLARVTFPNDPTYQVPSIAQMEAMCEIVQKEEDLKLKYSPTPKPTIQQQLENLWSDIDTNRLNKDGSFYKSLFSHLHK
jgi:hypothetical protein